LAVVTVDTTGFLSGSWELKMKGSPGALGSVRDGTFQIRFPFLDHHPPPRG
jgi:hypothetical protein